MDQERHGADPNDDDDEVRGGGPHPGEQSLVTRRDILQEKSLYTSNQNPVLSTILQPHPTVKF